MGVSTTPLAARSILFCPVLRSLVAIWVAKGVHAPSPLPAGLVGRFVVRDHGGQELVISSIGSRQAVQIKTRPSPPKRRPRRVRTSRSPYTSLTAGRINPSANCVPARANRGQSIELPGVLQTGHDARAGIFGTAVGSTCWADRIQSREWPRIAPSPCPGPQLSQANLSTIKNDHERVVVTRSSLWWRSARFSSAAATSLPSS